MVHRHYGLRTTKPHDPTQGSLAPHPGAADGFIRAIAIVMLVMGVTLYESATFTDTADTAVIAFATGPGVSTSAPSTTDQGVYRPCADAAALTGSRPARPHAARAG
jgi:hypothetical protein